MVGVVARAAIVPTPPVISAGGVTSTTATINLLVPSFEPITGISGYQLLRRPAGTSAFSVVATGILATSFSYTDTGLTQGTSYEYALRGQDNSAQRDYSPLSNVLSLTTNSVTPPVTGNINFTPGNYMLVGNVFGSNGVTDNQTVANIGLNGLPGYWKGLMCCYFWSQLENPNQRGDYSGTWDSSGRSGFPAIKQMIDFCNAKGITFSMSVNLSGNGQNSGSATFPSRYVPNYLNDVNYGPVSGNNHGGLYYTNTAANGVTTPVGPIARIWNPNVMAEFARVMTDYNAQFPGKIYCWDPIMELATGSYPTESGYNDSAMVSTLKTFTKSARAGSPTSLIILRLTFLRGMSAYAPTALGGLGVYEAIAGNQISGANYDSCVEHGSQYNRPINGDMAARGLWNNGPVNEFGKTSVVAQSGWPNWIAQGLDFHTQSTADTLGQRNATGVVPPAHLASGIITDINSHDVDQSTTHHWWYMNQQWGPNCNRVTQATNYTPPDNYSPPGGAKAWPSPSLFTQLKTYVVPRTTKPALLGN